jgi:hypothetical protein
MVIKSQLSLEHETKRNILNTNTDIKVRKTSQERSYREGYEKEKKSCGEGSLRNRAKPGC